MNDDKYNEVMEVIRIVLTTLVKITLIILMIIWGFMVVIFTGSARGFAKANGRTAGGQ